MVKITTNVQERLKGASVEADFWYGENIDHVQKKNLKIASFTKAPFMVKLDFWNKTMGIFAMFLNLN